VKNEYLKELREELKQIHDRLEKGWTSCDIDRYFARGINFAIKVAERLDDQGGGE